MKVLLNADEVCEVCRIKKNKAYKIIKEINEEMEKKGYITIRGKVNRAYLLKRLGAEEMV